MQHYSKFIRPAIVGGGIVIPTLVTGLVSLTSCGNRRVTEIERPNIVLILADDLGFSDLGCYGGEIDTPNIDALAANGLRYSQFYNATRSCPSRASLLTGLTPHAAGVGHMVADRGYDGYRGTLIPGTVTLAEALSECGYSTAMSGKWHVTRNTSPEGDISGWPIQRGFERFYGTLTGHGSFFDPKCLYDGNEPVSAEGDYYYTEAITDHARIYIDEMAGKGKPFFLYVAYTAPHYPIQARQEFIDKYRGRFSSGWDSLRLARFQRMSQIGIVAQGTALPEADPQCYEWSDEEHKTWQQERMEVYAAMVEQMDAGVGAIVDRLRSLNLLENTIIMFLSDNGPSNEGHLWNTIERTGAPWRDRMIPDSTRDGLPVTPGDIPGLSPGGADTYASYGPQWAHLCATPFRRYKSWCHEGGICTPLVVHWPEAITDGGSIRHGVYGIQDFMPTFLELAGGTYPETIKGVASIPIEGESLIPTFTSDHNNDERVMCWEHEGNKAVRKGRWKLVSEYPGSWSTFRPYPKGGNWELYDMSNDRTETCDLAAKYPELVTELAAHWGAWATRTGVMDWKAMGGEKW